MTLEIGDTEKMFRFAGNTLYGVVSPKYKKLDNIRLLEIIESAQDAGIGLKPVNYNFNPDHSRVTLVPMDIEVGELAPTVNFSNSENGMGSLSIWAGTYRWICTNGMMVSVGDVTRSRWMHKGINDIELPDLGVVLNRSREYVERLNESRNEYLPISRRAEVVVDIAKSLGRKVAEKVVAVANTEYHGGRTKFDAVNAITRAAQFFQPGEQTVIEQYAGQLLAA